MHQIVFQSGQQSRCFDFRDHILSPAPLFNLGAGLGELLGAYTQRRAVQCMCRV